MGSGLDCFCHNVHFLRQQHHLSQKQMAERLGISVYAIRKLERGSVSESITIDTVYAIYKQFGIKPADQFSKYLDAESSIACK